MLLLTSAGVKNSGINDALIELLDKPIAESSALCMPTVTYANPRGAVQEWRFLTGQSTTPMTELGWKSVGVFELTAPPSLDDEY